MSLYHRVDDREVFPGEGREQFSAPWKVLRDIREKPDLANVMVHIE